MLLAGQKYRINTDKAFVNILTIGDLSSLHWIESPLKYFSSADHPDRQLCRVHYAALNFRDVALATGKLPLDTAPGMYCTGSSYDNNLLSSQWSIVNQGGRFTGPVGANLPLGRTTASTERVPITGVKGSYLYSAQRKWHNANCATAKIIV